MKTFRQFKIFRSGSSSQRSLLSKLFPFLCAIIIFCSPFTSYASDIWVSVSPTLFSEQVGYLHPDSVNFVSDYSYISGSFGVSGNNVRLSPTYDSSGKVTKYSVFWDNLQINSGSTNITSLVYPCFGGDVLGHIRLRQSDDTTMPAGTYRGTLTVSASPSFYSTSGKALYTLGLTDAYLLCNGIKVPGTIIGGNVIFNFNDIYVSRSGVWDLVFTGNGTAVFDQQVNITSGGSFSLSRDDFRVNFGFSLLSHNLSYHPGDPYTPGNLNDYNSDQAAFDDQMSEGSSKENNLTSFALTNVDSFELSDPSSGSGMASALSFYSAVVTAGYVSLGDFQNLFVISLVIIVIMVLLRIRRN